MAGLCSALGLAVSLAGCAPGTSFSGLLGQFFGRPGAPALHYVVGTPYETGGVWRYPREQFEYDDTGLAVVDGPHPSLTADGESFDAAVLAAGHRTLQLPAIVRVTNLENGREVVVRLNDRGPADPGRLIAITRRTAQLLAVADDRAVRVRVQLLEAESRAAAADAQGDRGASGAWRTAGTGATVPQLSVATAPRAGVQAESLAAPAGATAEQAASPTAGPVVAATTTATLPEARVPLRLPETVAQGPAQPGQLFVECGRFGEAGAANMQRAHLARLGAFATTDYNAPRDEAYMVRIGPFATVGPAEAALHRALALGAPDSRIIVE